MGDAGGVNHRVDAGQRLGHVVGLGEIANEDAGAALRHHGGTPQQDAQPVPSGRQAFEEVPADEARGAGERHERLTVKLLWSCARHLTSSQPQFGQSKPSRMGRLAAGETGSSKPGRADTGRRPQF